MLAQSPTPSFYALGVVMLQLLTEQGPLGLLSAVKEALDGGTLMNLVPRLPVNAQVWGRGLNARAMGRGRGRER